MTTSSGHTEESASKPVKTYAVFFELEFLKEPPECWSLSADTVRQTLRQLFENDSLRVGVVTVREEHRT